MKFESESKCCPILSTFCKSKICRIFRLIYVGFGFSFHFGKEDVSLPLLSVPVDGLKWQTGLFSVRQGRKITPSFWKALFNHSSLSVISQVYVNN